MKVCFFLFSFPKISETFVLNQITGLIDQGADVSIVAYNKNHESKLQSDVNTYQLLNKASFILDSRNDNKFRKVLFLLRSVLVKRNCRLNPFKWAGIHIANGKHKFIGEADVVVAHFGPAGVMADQLIKVGLLKGKLVTVFHGFDISVKSVVKQYQEAYRELFRSGTLFLPISELWKTRLIEMGCNPEKIKVHRMGVNVGELETGGKANVGNGTVNILTVARLTEKKGIVYALEAISEIKSDYKIQYNIIGDGTLIDNLKCRVKELGVEEQVNFLGALNSAEIRSYFRESDIFLLPSVTAEDGDMEGVPVSLMESMYSGLLTISTYHSGIPELIDHNVNGFLAEERDVITLKEEIIKAIRLEGKSREKIVSNARDKVESHFNNEKLNIELFKILKEL